MQRRTEPRLFGQAYESERLSAQPSLVIVLHGDAPFHKPGVQYQVASRIAEECQDVISVGLLRPGYTDPRGNRSPGKRGWATGDNFTPDVIASVAATIAELKQRHGARQVVVVGHSGGAAVTANLLGMATGLVQSAVLVACPCDVARFRAHMRAKRWDPVSWLIWSWPARSLSPIDLVERIDRSTQIRMFVGSADDVTPPALSEAYAQRAREHGLAVHLMVMDGRDHEIFLDDEVCAAVKAVLGTCPGVGARTSA